MFSRISNIPCFLVGALICCYATVSLSYSFTDDNLIKVVTDYVYNTESSILSITDDIHDGLSFSSFSPSETIEAIYQFGDSISDTGNLIHENPRSCYAKLPYGRTSFHKPTGRASNGLLMIDYFTKFFNLPFLDPYLNKDGNFTHGVNFAVAGASALNYSALAMKDIVSHVTNSSLDVQLDWFKSHLNSICYSVSERKEKLAKSLIVMGEVGGNDYNWALFQRKNISEVYKMVPEVVQVIKKAIKEVISLGAIRIAVPGNFPIGCLPIYLAMFVTNDPRMYDEQQCLKYLNTFAKFHNSKIQEIIRELNNVHPHVTIVYADYFSALKEILQHATSLGFGEDVMEIVCCGIGKNEYNFDYDKMCGSEGVFACEHPEKHISWDGIHLTQHTYELMANWLIRHNFQSIVSTT